MMTSVLLMIWATTAQPPAGGKDTFLANGCNRCHAVSSREIEATVKSESMRGPDLATGDPEHDSEWMKEYIGRRLELDGKKHRSRYAGTSEDLEVIVKWLVEIRSD